LISAAPLPTAPHTGTWTLNEFVLVGGDATSDNLPPRFSQIQYAWRSPSLGIQQQIYNVLEKNARHVAAMTGRSASVRWVTKARVGLTNYAMTDLTLGNMELVGAPRFPDEAGDFARQIQSNLGLEPMDNPFLDDNERLMPPSEYEARLRRAFRMADPLHLGRLCRLHLARADRAPPDDAAAAASAERRLRVYPAWAHNALGGLPAAINPGIFLGAKTIAATLLDLLTEPALLQQAQDEFRERTGGGVAGKKWITPLLPKDFQPPVDLRWPEYIQTARGEEWWIPTPAAGSGAGDPL
jgi:aminobenzoyl-glutamate utilization protein B